MSAHRISRKPSNKARLRDLETRMAAMETRLVEPVPIAHILSPATKLQEALDGKQPESLCGEKIAQRSQAGANVCRKCFDLNVVRQQTEAGKWMTDAREEGRVAGDQQGALRGRAESMQEIRQAAEQRASELAAAS